MGWSQYSEPNQRGLEGGWDEGLGEGVPNKKSTLSMSLGKDQSLKKYLIGAIEFQKLEKPCRKSANGEVGLIKRGKDTKN